MTSLEIILLSSLFVLVVGLLFGLALLDRVAREVHEINLELIERERTNKEP